MHRIPYLRKLGERSARSVHLALLGAILHAGVAGAATDPFTRVPDAFIYCTTCHGVELRGNDAVDAPRLNGMEDWYVRNQMRAFARGWRGTHPEDLIGMEMQPQAAALSEAQIEAAVKFVRSVPTREWTGRTTVSGDAARGAGLYVSCAACHGTRGEGNPTLQAPRLAGQSDWYLVRQLEQYASGARGHDPADTLGMQMRAATAVLNGSDDARDLVAYINALTTHRPQPSEENP